jgi:hypothetical protein
MEMVATHWPSRSQIGEAMQATAYSDSPAWIDRRDSNA